MQDLLTCLEHQSIPVRPHRKQGEVALTIAQARQLEKLAHIPADAFRWSNQCIRWRQYCGVVQLNGVTLEILPKIHSGEPGAGDCRTALVKLLRRAGLIKTHRGSTASINTQNHSLLEIFIHEFCLDLGEQTILGKPRAYQQREGNLGKLKGRLLTSQQLRRNQVHRERLFCRFDELTDDIIINQAIKFTLRLLLPQCRSNITRKAVREHLMRHDDIGDVAITSAKLDRIILDRTNERYKRVLDWCRLFIDATNPDVLAGEAHLLSVLFDMNRLFERWVAMELRPLARGMGLSIREQAPRRYLAIRQDLDVAVFQTRPDISVVDASGKVLGILDAKWKLLDGTGAGLGISQADVYQISAYAHLYGIGQVALIYPRNQGIAAKYHLQLMGDRPRNLSIITADLEMNSKKQAPLKQIIEEIAGAA